MWSGAFSGSTGRDNVARLIAAPEPHNGTTRHASNFQYKVSGRSAAFSEHLLGTAAAAAGCVPGARHAGRVAELAWAAGFRHAVGGGGAEAAYAIWPCPASSVSRRAASQCCISGNGLPARELGCKCGGVSCNWRWSWRFLRPQPPQHVGEPLG
jgi:hypothetical protein